MSVRVLGANSRSFCAKGVRLLGLFCGVNWFTVRCPFRYRIPISFFQVILGSGSVLRDLYVVSSCKCESACLW